eukprot:TRINITY_DN8219_c0_g1_i1.p1 TRINITY_DN8219_c0_g1~~TRINITY_DN8219_c0_g1_i1.p1  ORF type:complete len:131 (-),score=8.32 TRINITY_DN8219_c0_g1_i1:348-740(-)
MQYHLELQCFVVFLFLMFLARAMAPFFFPCELAFNVLKPLLAKPFGISCNMKGKNQGVKHFFFFFFLIFNFFYWEHFLLDMHKKPTLSHQLGKKVNKNNEETPKNQNPWEKNEKKNKRKRLKRKLRISKI